MKRVVKVVAGVALIMSMGSVTLNADVSKGQRLYLKKLKSVCGFNGAIMADKHTVDEWEEIYESGKLPSTIKEACPKVKDSSLKEKYMKHYRDFFKEYGSDSGNIPSC